LRLVLDLTFVPVHGHLALSLQTSRYPAFLNVCGARSLTERCHLLAGHFADHWHCPAAGLEKCWRKIDNLDIYTEALR
jgi:hypothetical protein